MMGECGKSSCSGDDPSVNGSGDYGCHCNNTSNRYDQGHSNSDNICTSCTARRGALPLLTNSAPINEISGMVVEEPPTAATSTATTTPSSPVSPPPPSSPACSSLSVSPPPPAQVALPSPPVSLPATSDLVLLSVWLEKGRTLLFLCSSLQPPSVPLQEFYNNTLPVLWDTVGAVKLARRADSKSEKRKHVEGRARDSRRLAKEGEAERRSVDSRCAKNDLQRKSTGRRNHARGGESTDMSADTLAELPICQRTENLLQNLPKNDSGGNSSSDNRESSSGADATDVTAVASDAEYNATLVGRRRLGGIVYVQNNQPTDFGELRDACLLLGIRLLPRRVVIVLGGSAVPSEWPKWPARDISQDSENSAVSLPESSNAGAEDSDGVSVALRPPSPCKKLSTGSANGFANGIPNETGVVGVPFGCTMADSSAAAPTVETEAADFRPMVYDSFGKGMNSSVRRMSNKWLCAEKDRTKTIWTAEKLRGFSSELPPASADIHRPLLREVGIYEQSSRPLAAAATPDFPCVPHSSPPIKRRGGGRYWSGWSDHCGRGDLGYMGGGGSGSQKRMKEVGLLGACQATQVGVGNSSSGDLSFVDCGHLQDTFYDNFVYRRKRLCGREWLAWSPRENFGPSVNGGSMDQSTYCRSPFVASSYNCRGENRGDDFSRRTAAAEWTGGGAPVRAAAADVWQIGREGTEQRWERFAEPIDGGSSNFKWDSFSSSCVGSYDREGAQGGRGGKGRYEDGVGGGWQHCSPPTGDVGIDGGLQGFSNFGFMSRSRLWAEVNGRNAGSRAGPINFPLRFNSQSSTMFVKGENVGGCNTLGSRDDVPAVSACVMTSTAESPSSESALPQPLLPSTQSRTLVHSPPPAVLLSARSSVHSPPPNLLASSASPFTPPPPSFPADRTTTTTTTIWTRQVAGHYGSMAPKCAGGYPSGVTQPLLQHAGIVDLSTTHQANARQSLWPQMKAMWGI